MRVITAVSVVVLGFFAFGCGSDPADPIPPPSAPSGQAQSASNSVQSALDSNVNGALANATGNVDANQNEQGEADDRSEHGNNGLGNGLDPQPSVHAPINDGPGSSPGHPQAKDH
jgi:hypothetical protein